RRRVWSSLAAVVSTVQLSQNNGSVRRRTTAVTDPVARPVHAPQDAEYGCTKGRPIPYRKQRSPEVGGNHTVGPHEFFGGLVKHSPQGSVVLLQLTEGAPPLLELVSRRSGFSAGRFGIPTLVDKLLHQLACLACARRGRSRIDIHKRASGSSPGQRCGSRSHRRYVLRTQLLRPQEGGDPVGCGLRIPLLDESERAR